MIENLSSIKDLLGSGHGEAIVSKFGQGGKLVAVKIHTGHILTRRWLCLPVIDGKTSLNVFGDARRERYDPLLAADIQPTGEFSDAVFVGAAGNGRNVSNQAEVEAWLATRGYVSINPGTLSMEQQIVLFSRATHIVGVEGAAMTNMLFAINATAVTLIASPATNGEKFFSALAKHCSFSFQTVYGEIAASEAVTRSANFTMPIEKLEALGLT